MRSSFSIFISRAALLAILSGAFAAPALAAAVSPGHGGSSPAGPSANGAHANALNHRSVGCTTVSFGKMVATGFVSQNGLAPNGQPCNNGDTGN
jgi:hypothetical protein